MKGSTKKLIGRLKSIRGLHSHKPGHRKEIAEGYKKYRKSWGHRETNKDILRG